MFDLENVKCFSVLNVKIFTTDNFFYISFWQTHI